MKITKTLKGNLEQYFKLLSDLVEDVFGKDISFVAAAKKLLLGLDRERFSELFETKLRKLFLKLEKAVRAEGLERFRGDILAASIQYDSAVFGRWLRFRLTLPK